MSNAKPSMFRADWTSTRKDLVKILSKDGFFGHCMKLREEGEGEIAKFITTFVESGSLGS